MKNQAPLKSMLRQPVQLALTVALVAFAAFAFISRVAEGLVVGGEIERLTGLYHSVGTLTPTAEELKQQDLRIPEEAVELIESHPAVEYVNSRRIISGVMEDLYTPDIDGYSPYVTGMYVTGTLTGKAKAQTAYWDYYIDFYTFGIQIDQILLCHPDHLANNEETLIFYLADVDGDLRHVFEEAVEGERYFVKGQYGDVNGLFSSPQPPTTLETSKMMRPLLRPQPETGLYLLPAPQGTDVVTDALEQEMEILDENLHTVFLCPTKDMTALPQANETLVTSEGRLLNRQDDLRGNRVCVIRREFAELRGLNLGDTIELTMRRLEAVHEFAKPDVYSNHTTTRYGVASPMGADSMHALEMATGYITDSAADQSWRQAETRQETLEIVGIYDATENVNRLNTVNWNYVYVPDSCVPADWTQNPVYTGFSLVLSSPRQEKDVIRDLRSQLDDMGYWLEFKDSGWDRFAASVFPIRTSIMFGVAIFTVVSLAVLYLVVFLHFRRRRQEFAIMRALGCSGRTAAVGTALSILLAGIVGIAAGSIPAWYYALGKARETLTAIAGAENTGLPLIWLPALMLLLLALFGLFTALFARSLSRRPVLELLQGKQAGTRAAAQPQAETGRSQTAPPPVVAPVRHTPVAPAAPVARARGGTAHTLGFAVKRTVRSPGKSILVLLLAAGFLLVLSWMPASIASNIRRVDEIYNTTVVTGVIILDLSGTGGMTGEDGAILADSTRNIPGKTLRAILATGYIAEYYTDVYQRMTATVVNDTPTGFLLEGYLASPYVVGISGLNRYEELVDTSLTIEYAPGYGPEIFDKTEAEGDLTAIVSRSMLERLDARLGEYVGMLSQNRNSKFYKIVGCFDDFTDTASFTPVQIILPLADLHAHTMAVHYNRAEFQLDPAKNRELEPFREEIKEIFAKPTWPQLKFVLRDYELTDVVEPLERNIQLMEVLYPIAVAVAALISAATSLLLVLQSVEDAAKMRVLGTTKSQVCGALIFEQGLLCAMGLTLGGLICLPLYGSANQTAAGVCLACCLAAAFVGGLSVIRKKPLELLQVKE